MSTVGSSRVRAVADHAERTVVATVDIAAPLQRVFRALASSEIIHWWVRPGVFDTRQWSGDLRVGGRWKASGMSRGQRYEQGGEFVEIDEPRKLVHTWDGAGMVTYLLEPLERGTRLTLRQSGFPSTDMCDAFAIGWETSLHQLADVLGGA